MAQCIWVKLTSPIETPLIKIFLKDVLDVDDLKTAIKAKLSEELRGYSATTLILKAKKMTENDDQVVQLHDPAMSIASIQQRLGAGFRVLVSVETGMYILQTCTAFFA